MATCRWRLPGTTPAKAQWINTRASHLSRDPKLCEQDRRDLRKDLSSSMPPDDHRIAFRLIQIVGPIASERVC